MDAKSGLGIDDLIGTKRDAILRLAEDYGVHHVRVFGSAARGVARQASDIDFLIDFPPDRTMFDLVALWQALQDLLERKVSLVTEGSLDANFAATIAGDLRTL